MAVYDLTTDTDGIGRTTSGPCNSTISWACGFWIFSSAAPTPANAAILYVDDGTSSVQIYFTSGGNIGVKEDGFAGSAGTYGAHNSWAYVSMNAVQFNANLNVNGSAVITTGFYGTINSSLPQFNVGKSDHDPYTYPTHGFRIAYLKVWDTNVALSTIDAERYSPRAIYRTNLWGEFPLIGSGPNLRANQAGNGYDLSEYGSPSVVDDHPGIQHHAVTIFPQGATAAGNVTVTPGTATLTLTPYAPTVSTPVTVTPSTASLTLTPYAPTVATPVVVTPTTASLTLTPFAPTVTAPATVTPTTATLTLTPYAPTVSTPVVVTPTTATLTLTPFAPTVSTPVVVTPITASLTLTTFIPTVTAGGNVTATPPTASLTLTPYIPTVSVGGGPTVVTPGTASLVLTPYAPSILGPVLATPLTATLILTPYIPTVTLYPVPYSGFVIPSDCELIKLALSISAASGSATVELFRNRVPTGVIVTLTSSSKVVYTLPTPLSLYAADVITFRTTSATGATGPATISVELRKV